MTIDTDHPTTTDPGPGVGQSVELVRAAPDPDRIQHLDPRSLLMDRNVRDHSAADAAADRRMAASVREVGLLQPIIAVVTDEGHARVLFGHRRTHGAIAAGAATVPVIVRADDGDATAAEAARIANQIIENHVRQGLSPAEQLTAFADLAALGRTPGQIAKMTKASRRDVVDALKAAGSAEARDAVVAADLTLEQGATLAEFADDEPAYSALLDTATGGGRSWESFEHVAARLREDRTEQAHRAAALDQLTTAGVTVITAPSHSGPVTDLDNLTNDPEQDPAPDGEPRPEPVAITPAEHADCPGHAAYLRRSYRGPSLVVAVYVCTDPLAHGHRARRAYVRLSAPAAPPQRIGETTEQAAAREAAAKEAETAARRRVLAGNKSWRAAETVRREYLRTLLARKTPPKGAGVYLAATLTLDSFAITKAAEKGHSLAALLLTGHEDLVSRDRIVKLTDGASDARGQVVGLGLILAGIEASTGVHSWRHADDGRGSDWRGESPALGRYLRFLAATGYELAPVERFAIGEDVDEATVFTPPGREHTDLDLADDDQSGDEPVDGVGTGDTD